MDTSNNIPIIIKFMAKEIEMVCRRYCEVSMEEASVIAEFIRKVEKNHIEFEPYLNYETTKALAENCKGVEEADFISFYIFVRCDIALKVDIKEARELYERLQCNGYVEIQCYYIYHKHGKSGTEESIKGYSDSNAREIYYRYIGEE
ncbi:hypothetical protein ACJDU8_02035 [Clostridium sp. WILCCON 0269]|uniref:Uncharacterized protein n=1 Tax=Candidatus Clostridium eludens TaxID=3381663 RepID=A0ABW8SEH8_9CLOT